jgi:Methyltransferase domain
MTRLDREYDKVIRSAATESRDRLDLWVKLLRSLEVCSVAEVGVYRGQFARRMLGECPGIQTYYLIDPWRSLPRLDKPLARSEKNWDRVYAEAVQATEPFAHRRVVLRGTTQEVIDRIPDGCLDLVYLDGDHTLRGIAIDLVKVLPKVRNGGWIAGDDFCANLWQHGPRYEPTLTFPFAAYFAEAIDAPIYALPWNQFLIAKTSGGHHEFVDLVGRYSMRGLKQLQYGWSARLAWGFRALWRRVLRAGAIGG